MEAPGVHTVPGMEIRQSDEPRHLHRQVVRGIVTQVDIKITF